MLRSCTCDRELVAQPAVSMLNIAPSATSPQLVNSDIYRNTFRPIASSLGFIDMYAEFVSTRGYAKVGILFEAERTNHIEAARYLHKQLLEVGVSVASFGMFDKFSIPLSRIVNQYRIIFVFGGGGISRKLMCMAYEMGMNYPSYQFIFSERRLKHFVGKNVTFKLNGEAFDCHEAEMNQSILGIILSQIRLTRHDHDTRLESGLTYTQFYRNYKRQMDAYAKSLGLSQSDIVDTEHQSGYYDSTWALALSFHAAIPRLQKEFNISLDQYRLGHPDITEVIRDELLKVRFEGVRGTIRFNRTTLDGVDVTVLDMFQVQESDSKIGHPMLVPVATYYPGDKLHISDPSVFIEDMFVTEVISAPVFVEVFVFIAVFVVTLSTVVFHILTVKWTAMKSLKATSAALNHMIFAGCYLYILSILFLSLQLLPLAQHPVVFGVRCSGFIWCESLALTLIFGTISVKTWRVYRIFSHSSAKILANLENHRLILHVVGLILVDIAFNIAWNLNDPWFGDLAQREALKIRVICKCDNFVIWLSCLFALKGLLTFVVLYLSIATRRIPKQEFKQTKSTNALVYSLIFLYSFTIPVYIILLDRISVALVTVSYVALCLKNIMCVVLCTIFIFIPPMLPILRKQ